MAERSPLLKIVVELIDQASAPLRGLSERINAMVQAGGRARQSAANLTIAGGVMEGAAAAILVPMKGTLGAYMDEEAELARVRTAMGETATTMQDLNEVQRVTTDLSEHSAATAVSLMEGYYMARSNMLSHKDSLEAVRLANELTIATTMNAADAQRELAPTTRTLTELYNVFGGSLSKYHDQLVKFQTQYGFKDIGEVTYGLSYAIPAAKRSGVAAEEMLASMALLAAGGKYSQEAGTNFAALMETLTTDKQLAGFLVRTRDGMVDVQQTILGLKRVFGGYPAADMNRYLSNMGISGEAASALTIMMSQIDKMAGAEADFANSSGAAAVAEKIRAGATDEQLAETVNKLTALKVAIGENLRGPLISLATHLGAVLLKLTEFAKTHQPFIKFALLTGIITAGFLALSGAILLATAALAPVVAILGIGAGWLLLWAVAIAAVAAGVILIYRNWGAAVDYVKNIDWKTVGMDILRGIGRGILDGLIFLTGPLGTVAKYIIGHFPHSPAQFGPLRDLNRIRIVEQVASTIKPHPMLQAIRRTAAAAAVAIPMAIGAGAMPAAAATMHAGAGVSAGTVINISLTCNFDGDASADFKGDARKYAYEMVEAMHKELRRRQRTDF